MSGLPAKNRSPIQTRIQSYFSPVKDTSSAHIATNISDSPCSITSNKRSAAKASLTPVGELRSASLSNDATAPCGDHSPAHDNVKKQRVYFYDNELLSAPEEDLPLTLASEASEIESVSEHENTSDVSAYSWLPDWSDIAGLIAEFMLPEDIARLRCVSRAWRAASTHLTSQLHKLTLEGIQCMPALPNPGDMQRIERLDLRRYASGMLACPTRQQWLQQLLQDDRCCNRLRSLQIGPHMSHSLLGTMLSRCGSLEALSIRGLEAFGDDGIAKLNSPILRTFEAWRCWKLTDAGLEMLIAKAMHIQRISLKMCPRITSEGVEQLVTGLKYLTSMEIDCFHPSMNSDALKRIVQHAAGRLRVLRICDASMDEHDWIQLLRCMCALLGDDVLYVELDNPHGFPTRIAEMFAFPTGCSVQVRATNCDTDVQNALHALQSHT